MASKKEEVKKSTRIPREYWQAKCRICGASGKRPKLGEPEICEHRARKEGFLPEDVIRREYDVDKKEIIVHLPQIGMCGGCGGYKNVRVGREAIEDPELTLRVALIEYGYAVIKHDDRDIPCRKCNCKEELPKLRKFVESLAIKHDSGWYTLGSSIPSRGIHDYERAITFLQELIPEELEKVRLWLRLDNCPGYTHLTAIPVGKGVYRFQTTCDSSD